MKPGEYQKYLAVILFTLAGFIEYFYGPANFPIAIGALLLMIFALYIGSTYINKSTGQV